MSQQALMRRIEREARKATKQARKIYKMTAQAAKRKEPTHCEKCGVAHGNLRRYVDESNIAIIMSSKALCPACYRETYGY